MAEAIAPIPYPSPNFGPRRDGARPDMIVLHYTAMTSAEAALERLCDPEAEVSAHYLIGEQGQLWQMVDEDMRAWHAGAGAWGGVSDVNSRSIGIELANLGSHPFSEPQMAALEALLADIMARWAIPPERVIGHSDMAPERKCDPGPRFDWRRLALQGLSVWPDNIDGAICPEIVTLQNYLRLARIIGYEMSKEDSDIVHAIRARYAPWLQGALTEGDFAILVGLIRRIY